MKDDYPYLKNKSILCINPEGGCIYSLPNKESPREDYFFLFRNFIEITRFQRDILKLSNGERSTRDIAQIISNEYCVDPEITLMNIVEKLNVFLKKGVIEISKKPISCNVVSKGSEKYFSPLHVSLEITTRCNIGCTYCYRKAGEGKTMDIETNKLLPKLDELASLGLTTIEITGGEPFLHKDFPLILEYCLEKFEICAVLTSGTLISDTFLDQFEEYIRNRRLIFSITIDGSKPEIHDKFRVIDGSWEKAIRSVKRILSKEGVIMVVTNLLPENIDDIENTAILMEEMGVTVFSPNFIAPAGRALELDWAKDYSQKLEKFANNCQELSNRHNNMLKFPQQISENNNKGTNCGAGYRYWAISPEGIIRPCIIMDEKILPIGNLLKIDLKEILNNQAIKELWAMKSPCRAICGDCTLFDRCAFCSYHGLLNAPAMANKCSWLESTHLGNFVNWDIIGHINACITKQHHIYKR